MAGQFELHGRKNAVCICFHENPTIVYIATTPIMLNKVGQREENDLTSVDGR